MAGTLSTLNTGENYKFFLFTTPRQWDRVKSSKERVRERETERNRAGERERWRAAFHLHFERLASQPQITKKEKSMQHFGSVALATLMSMMFWFCVLLG